MSYTEQKCHQIRDLMVFQTISAKSEWKRKKVCLFFKCPAEILPYS